MSDRNKPEEEWATMPVDGKLPWDVDVDSTCAGMERFIRALVVSRGHFTDSFTLGSDLTKPSRDTVFFRVWIPEGKELFFLELSKCEELRPPPRVQVGMGLHPQGRQRPVIKRSKDEKKT